MFLSHTPTRVLSLALTGGTGEQILFDTVGSGGALSEPDCHYMECNHFTSDGLYSVFKEHIIQRINKLSENVLVSWWISYVI